ncbi:S-adenosyl methyltransferase [Parafrankia irregularis]|uniref:S-adenosyl methyltransferase n=1 Tax=Parafrankia irregularis TaxID=795642 RepID=A0A0S4QJ82_9ACTN|nr:MULTISPECIES: SAM-dependent methyltransferase [Parafrankia]MBE3203805.1 SAM-dependent methyltransferase [Parafrankia sp. CH37]CUU55326.1 S-adenosyl methyltransferase [Parafrankia irregularis]
MTTEAEPNDGGTSVIIADGTPLDVDLKTDVPHPARVYDYILGGTENFPADRAAAAEFSRHLPNLPTSMRANRNFMARVAHNLAAEHGIRQFLDIGSGLPTSPNLHEVAQRVAPESRVVYVDRDPIVLLHARPLLTSTPEGSTAYLDADLSRPQEILQSAQLQETLDLSKPVAVSLLAVVQFIPDDAIVKNVISELLAPLAPGSILAISTVTADFAPEEVADGTAAYRASGIPMVSRDLTAVAAFFGGLELLDPGIVLVHRWHPDAESAAIEDSHVYMYGGVARKP